MFIRVFVCVRSMRLFVRVVVAGAVVGFLVVRGRNWNRRIA